MELRRAEFVDQLEVGAGKVGFCCIEFFAQVTDGDVMGTLREVVYSDG
jgi:hypothetical protein